MERLKLLLLASILIVGISLSSCYRGGSKSSVQASTTTTGQELLDLKKSYDAGIITEKEYDKKKKQILKKK